MVTLDLQNLLVCRNILKDKLIQELDAAVSSPEDLALAHRFAGHLLEKAEEEGWSGNLIRDLFLNLLSQEGCLAAKMAEASRGQIGTSLHQAFIHELQLLFEKKRPKWAAYGGTNEKGGRYFLESRKYQRTYV